MIVINGTATAKDVLELVSIMKTRVRDQFGIQLQEEVQIVGYGGGAGNRERGIGYREQGLKLEN